MPDSSRLIRDKQVEIEGRRDAGSIVIGGKQNVEWLLQIDADQQRGPFAEKPAHRAEKKNGLRAVEIADGRSGKKARTKMVLQRQLHSVEVVKTAENRMHAKAGKSRPMRRAAG